MNDQTLLETLDPGRLADLARQAEEMTEEDVFRALASPSPGLRGFLALISPAAAPHLEKMAHRAMRITRERFGRTVGLYAPLYLSNFCLNSCVYCGFNKANELRRTTLAPADIAAEARILWDQGFRNILLVSGEDARAVSMDYLKTAVDAVHGLFPAVSLEIYPLETGEYAELFARGVEGVTIYQETYNPGIYASMHPAGRKRDFARRLDTPDRAGMAGARRVGLGALLGLGPWRYEAAALALHSSWLKKKYWQTAVSVSFPRLRRAAGGFVPPCPMTDRELVQMATALRIFDPDMGLVLSTRESESFRNGLAPICISMMSAGSKTEPGGYSKPGEAGEQFAVEDRRTPAQVAEMLEKSGLDPVWKDWDAGFTGRTVNA